MRGASGSAYVGRIGALAVALGVGTAIIGLTAVASADSGAGNGSGSAGEESTQSGESGRSPARARAGNRRAPAAETPETSAVAAARRSRGLRSGTGSGGVTANSGGASAVTVPESPADLIGALLTPGGLSGLLQKSVTSLIGDLVTAVPAVGLVPETPSALQVADVAVFAEPPVMTAQPDVLSVTEGAPLAGLAGGNETGDPISTPLAWAAVAVSRQEDLSVAAAAVAPAATVTTGEPVDPMSLMSVGAPAGGVNICVSVRSCLQTFKPTITKQIAAAVVKADSSTEGVVADKIGAYGFAIIDALMSAAGQSAVAKPIQQMASDPDILNFVAQSVALKFAGAVVLGVPMPTAVANTIGNAAAYFVQNSFGNPDMIVAQQFVPFLDALNLPTTDGPAIEFALKINTDKAVFPAVLSSGKKNSARAISQTGMQTALVSFFGNTAVRDGLGSAAAGAISILLGGVNPLPSWATPTSPTAVADYVGQIGATAVLGAGSPDTSALSSTIGGAVSGLFSAVGNTVATQAGTAFEFLLSEGSVGGQPPVGTTLATWMTNGFVKYLGGDPQSGPVALLPTLAPAAGVAVTGFVNSLLATPSVPPALGAFINQLIPGMLANPGVQQVLSEQAAKSVAGLFNNDALGQALGAQVGAAVANLVAVPAVENALTALVNSLLGDILASPQAVTALANAAGEWVTVDLAGGPGQSDAKKAIIAGLRKNSAIGTAVSQAVSSGVTALFNNADVVTAVNNAAVSLITASLADPAVQQGLGTLVSSDVAKLFKNSALGNAVGAQAGAAVVAFVSNPDIRSALVSLVDTTFSDFLGVPGVIPAFSTAAGELAAAALADTLPVVQPTVIAELKANPAIQKAVGVAVGDAVKTLLNDPEVLAALNSTASSLVAGLLADPAVEAGLSAAVAKEVSTFLKGGPLGDAVGAQVGTAVAGLLSQQAVQNALAGLVDTELGDFVTAPGVVDAFVVAAETFALDVVAGGSTQAAAEAAVKSLRASTAVQNAVGGIVTTSVTELLKDSTLWSTVDAAAANLLGAVLAEPAVQAAVNEQVSTAISTALNGTAFGVAVGAQVAAAVVDLMKNPDISAGLVGVVDTVFKDFFGTDGVVTAFADAAGQLASAAVAGTFGPVFQQVQAELRANTAVQAGVNLAVGDAVKALLTDDKWLAALDTKLASLVSGLLGDPDVQAGLNDIIAKDVSSLFGGGALGEAVGAQVGTAVIEVLSNPIVKDALEGLVDTELGDFFRADGVVAAFAAAADTFALDVVTGDSVNGALIIAEKQLRANAAVGTAVDGIVTAAVAELLDNKGVWSAVDRAASFLVADLLADPEVQQAVYGKVYAPIWAAFNGTALGVAVGNKVAGAVVSLMQNPNVSLALVELVDTVSTDFFGYAGVVTALSDAAGELAAAAVADTLPTVGPQVQAQLRANPAIEQAAGLAVGDAVYALVTDPNVLTALDDTASDLVRGLLDDPIIQASLDAQITADVSKFFGGGTLGQTVGAQTATAVMTFLADPNVRAALLGLVDTELGDFFTSAGVAGAFEEAATEFTVEVVTGESVKTAADDAIAWLRASAPVDDAVDGIVTDSVATLLSNPYVVRAFSDGLTTLLTDLGPNAGQIAALLVTRSLAGSPSTASIAAPVGQAIGAAVQQLLTVPGFGSGVVTVITSVVPDFLGQFGVPSELAGVVGQFAASVVAGEKPNVAEQAALNALRTNPTIDSAAKTTVADSLSLINLTLLSYPAIQQALGATVTTLITTLAADAAIQAFIAERDGAAVAELLADAPVVAETATAVGAVVTQLLGYPGFTLALLGAINQFADDVIDEKGVLEAQQDALRQLQTAPAVVSAVKAVVPPQVGTLLGYPNVRQALGVVAQEDVIASLRKGGIDNRFLDRTAGQVADGTVDSLLARPAGVSLVDDLVVSIMLGMPAMDWRSFTTQEVIEKPALQIALGMSIGQGIGSLFGDNIIGGLIGFATGVPVTLAIGVGSAIIGFLDWILGGLRYDAAAPAPATAIAFDWQMIKVS